MNHDTLALASACLLLGGNMDQQPSGTTFATKWEVVQKEVIPDSFFQGIMDCECGRIVPLEKAISETPPLA